MSDTADKPQRRSLQFASPDQAIVDARHLAEAGYVKTGNWSLAEICEHLTKFMRNSLDGFPGRGMPWPIPPIMRGLFLNEKAMNKPMPPGLPTVNYLRPTVVTAANDETKRRADAEAVDRFAQQFERVRQAKEDNKTFAKSPLFGKLPAEKWYRVHLKHAALHLSFLVPTNDA